MKLFYVSVSYRKKGDRKRIFWSGGAIAENQDEAIEKLKKAFGSIPDNAKEVDWTAWEEEKGVFLLSPKKY